MRNVSSFGWGPMVLGEPYRESLMMAARAGIGPTYGDGSKWGPKVISDGNFLST